MKLGSALLAAHLWLVLAFLYVPIVVMAVFGFNASPLYALPFQFDLVWYRELAGNAKLIDAGINSVSIAIVNTIIATTLGTMAALAFARYQFHGKTILQLLLFPPVAIPWLVIGTAMLVFFFWVSTGLNWIEQGSGNFLRRGWVPILLGHVALSLPYVIVVVGARLATFPQAVEEAAATLGANPWQTFWRVTAPLLAPGIIGGGLFAFAVSFDQFVVSYFLGGPGMTTLPVEIYGAIRKGFTPEINAISTIIIVVSMGALLLTARFYRFGGER
jgi:spermidine/putrescine transport system permease protein